MQRKLSVSYVETARLLYGLHRRLRQQRPLMQQRLQQLAAEWQAPADLFSAKAVTRITKYWELSLHVICNSLYELTGKKLSEAEQTSILLLSIFGPLYDDLLDNNILDAEALSTLTRTPEQYVPLTAEARLAQQVYLLLLQQSPDPQRVKAHLLEVFTWQKASLKQKEAGISEAELYEITYRKSFHSILLFHSILDHYPSAELREMLYPAAGLLQLTNDAFDVYRDMQEGVYTIPSLYPDFEKIDQGFMSSVAAFNQQLAALPYPAAARARFAITIHALHGMGRMALAQLRRNTRHKPLQELSRRELVCDMDHFSRQLRWVGAVRTLVNY